MANMEDAILTELNGKGEIANTLFFAKERNFDVKALDGTLKSLLADNYVSLTNLEKEEVEFTEEGNKALKAGSPEFRLVSILKVGEEKTKDEIIKALGSKDELQIAINKGMQNKWITASKTTVKRVAPEELKDETAQKLAALVNNKNPKEHDKAMIQELKKRKMIVIRPIKFYKVSKGPNYRPKRIPEVADLTAEMLAKGTWEGVKFKKYNTESMGKEIETGNFHPLYQIRDEFRSIFLDLGFEEMPTNAFVDSSFWDFDVLFTAQQHPARDMQDTFYLTEPATCNTIPADLCEKVKKAHEGGSYGSIGYRYEWKLDEAKKNLMRTHTTPCSARMLYALAQETTKTGVFNPKKYFSIDRVFRNEATDATHLYEFHQVEGLIADFNLSLKQLMGIIGEFFKRLGITDLKYKPTYNPYTEPSMEIFGYHPILKRMVELGNSGIFRPEMLLALGLPEDATVIAWGVSLERPAMIHYKLDNIRDLLGHQVPLRFTKNNPIFCLPQLKLIFRIENSMCNSILTQYGLTKAIQQYKQDLFQQHVMETSYSNQISDDERSSSEPEIDQTIQVQRVHDAPEASYSPEEDEEYMGGESSDFAEQEYEVQSQYDAPSYWQVEEDSPEPEVDTEQYPQSEMSEPATVVTLYYSHHETLLFPEGSGYTSENSLSKPSDRYIGRKFRFTPAGASKTETRARSAPPVPLTDLQEFKGSREFVHLEAASINAGDLVYKDNGKLDLDSVEGHNAGKKFLDSIEVMMGSFSVNSKDRKYREKFSQAYRILYKDNALCYLTEILNSAQEGYPYIIVNSEKYIFSPNVLRAGEKLFYSFGRLKDSIKDLYNMYCLGCCIYRIRMCEEPLSEAINVKKMVADLRKYLEAFDKYWAIFEKVILFPQKKISSTCSNLC
eukprot:TRINITY_DN533_c4_g1_i1.p1 TRINITY_DN533_c4_g1~~TRINITY_DN533_c4_g1_i1.p1  ORF type:complete len:896 (+),score=108.64 TRINITY_DN533_c4_g1_i1:6026-8713(+)